MLPEYYRARLRVFDGEDEVESRRSELREVTRFAPFPFMEEDLYQHISNTRHRAMMWPVSEERWTLIDEYLKLHDLPELIIRDRVAYDESKSRLRSRKKQSAIESLSITERQREMIGEFNTAQEALSRNKGYEVVDEAVMAAVIDFSDAVEAFHLDAPHWFSTGSYSRTYEPVKAALVYAIDTTKTYIKSLESLDIDEEARVLCKQQLLLGLNWIVVHWDQVPSSRVPRAMRSRLKWAKSELEGVDIDKIEDTQQFFPLILLSWSIID